MYKCGKLFVANRNKNPILYEFDDGLRPNLYNGNMVHNYNNAMFSFTFVANIFIVFINKIMLKVNKVDTRAVVSCLVRVSFCRLRT